MPDKSLSIGSKQWLLWWINLKYPNLEEFGGEATLTSSRTLHFLKMNYTHTFHLLHLCEIRHQALVYSLPLPGSVEQYTIHIETHSL